MLKQNRPKNQSFTNIQNHKMPRHTNNLQKDIAADVLEMLTKKLIKQLLKNKYFG
jgi:hypothetical protein